MMGFRTGTCNGIGDYFDMIVMLMRVYRRIVNANVSQPANQVQRIHMKTF